MAPRANGAPLPNNPYQAYLQAEQARVPWGHSSPLPQPWIALSSLWRCMNEWTPRSLMCTYMHTQTSWPFLFARRKPVPPLVRPPSYYNDKWKRMRVFFSKQRELSWTVLCVRLYLFVLVILYVAVKCWIYFGQVSDVPVSEGPQPAVTVPGVTVEWDAVQFRKRRHCLRGYEADQVVVELEHL